MDNEQKMKYKTILITIQVPDCGYCWEPTPPYRICSYLGNDGSHPLCRLNLGELKYGNKMVCGVVKSQKCAMLTDNKE